MITEIRFWKDKILFRDGWYLYLHESGDCSVISAAVAKKKLVDYNEYQASQDISRGGMDRDSAYRCRGFQKINGDYVYMRKEAEELATGPIHELSETLVIPEKVGEFNINYLCKEAFAGEDILKTVVLHSKIKKIEYKAFHGCINLSDVKNVPEWIDIAQEVFTSTKLFDNDSIHYLGHVLFKADPTCVGKIVIKEGTHAISNYAFEDCAEITEVICPEGLRKIGIGAFFKCSNLERIRFSKEMDYIGEAAFNGCTKLNYVEIPQGIEVLNRNLFYDCENLSYLDFPVNIRKIGYDAFHNTSYMNRFMESDKTELYINNWLIHYKTDENLILNIKHGTIGIAGQDSINWSKPRKRSAVILPNTLKYLCQNALNMYALDEIILPESLLTIGHMAFAETKIKQITIPESVKKIEGHAFNRCEQLDKIVIKGKNTEVIWPAITDRRDKGEILIVAHRESPAYQYYLKYGEKYNFKFQNIEE